MGYAIGDKVFISAEVNNFWAGIGVVEDVYGDKRGVAVRMETGPAIGERGGFELSEVRPASLADTVMKIVKVTRTKNADTSLKVYGEVQGESGKVYKFAYFRRPTFRGWICSCENFLLSKFAKRLNCKHLHFVRAQVGRYGSQVPKCL